MQHREVWLCSNQRAALAGLFVPLILILAGLALERQWVTEVPVWARVVGWVLVGSAALMFAVLLWYARTPRLAFDGEYLLVYLRSAGPIRVPIDLVECFFLGSGLKQLPGQSGREVQMSHLAVRLAECATEWAQVDVKPALGKWCSGSVTIYGAWCEPLTVDVVKRLNARLSEVQRMQTAMAESDG
jgi:hypothetical protein